jgi:hypothetical protein
VRIRLPILLIAFALALLGCDMLRSTCEQGCYAQKTNEPRDFDDCIRRCKK